MNLAMFRNTIGAVDFDGTLCSFAYPDIGEPNMEVINNLKTLREVHGCKLILWTCREDDCLRKALAWCKELGLEFDAVNDNLPETTYSHLGNSRKVYADWYLDDRNVDPLMFSQL